MTANARNCWRRLTLVYHHLLSRPLLRWLVGCFPRQAQRARVEVEALEWRDTPDVAPLPLARWRAEDLASPAATQELGRAQVLLSLSNRSVPEHTPGAVVGRIVTSPAPAAAQTFTVSDRRFEVVHGQLKLKDGVSLHHEAAPTVALTITATDSTGSWATASFTLQVSSSENAPRPGTRSTISASFKTSPTEVAAPGEETTAVAGLASTATATTGTSPATTSAAGSRPSGGRRGARAASQAQDTASAALRDFLPSRALVFSAVPLSAADPAALPRLEGTLSENHVLDGRVFLESDGASLREPPGVAGVNVFLERLVGPEHAVVGFCRTDLQGRYHFGGIAPGAYRVRLDVPPDLELTGGEATPRVVVTRGQRPGPRFVLRRKDPGPRRSTAGDPSAVAAPPARQE